MSAALFHSFNEPDERGLVDSDMLDESRPASLRQQVRARVRG